MKTNWFLISLTIGVLLILTLSFKSGQDRDEKTQQALRDMQQQLNSLSELPEHSRTSEPPQQLSQLKADPAPLQHNWSPLEKEIHSDTNLPQTEIDYNANQADSSDRITREMEQEKENTERIAVTLDNMMLQEPADASWSAVTESEVNDLIDNSGEAIGTELYQVHCQSTLCRIEATHADQAAELDFSLQLGSLTAFGDSHAFIQRTEHDDGTRETVTYISRSGYKLPELMSN